MCYPKPGPRCSPHAYEQWGKARQAVKDADAQFTAAKAAAAADRARDGVVSNQTRDRLAQTEIAVYQAEMLERVRRRRYMATPAGLAGLQRKVDQHESRGDRMGAQVWRNRMAASQAERAQAMADYKDAYGEVGHGPGRGRPYEDPVYQQRWRVHRDPNGYTPAEGWDSFHETEGQALLDTHRMLAGFRYQAAHGATGVRMSGSQRLFLQEVGHLPDGGDGFTVLRHDRPEPTAEAEDVFGPSLAAAAR